MPSVKKNFAYSSILTTANYIFPLITFPYITRVLGVTNVGICNFVDSIINYFIIFSMLGIGTIGIREVAANKENKARLSQIFSSLLLLNIITTIIVLIVLVGAILWVPRFSEYRQMLFIGAFKLVFNCFLVEWFFKGLEDFRYITVRSIIVRSIYVVSVFLFVRKVDDYPIYYALTCGLVVVNAIINLQHVGKFTRFTFSNLQIKPFLGTFIVLGLYNILTSMYTTFNIMYLGFMGNDDEVGFYTTATKIHTIILSLYTAFTGVMLPRMSALLSENRIEEFHSMLHKSLDILFIFSIPICLFLLILTPDIIHLIAGNGYEKAIPCLRIIAPLIFIIGYEQIVIVQTLMPLKKDKAILTNSILGAVVATIANILLIRLYYSIGSSIVWLLSELTVLLSAQFFVHKYLSFSFPFREFKKYIFVSIPIGIVLLCLTFLKIHFVLRLFMGVFILVIYYLVIYTRVLPSATLNEIFSSIRRYVR